jgi:hypothetical protein
VWRLAGIDAPVADDAALDHLLSALPQYRDGQGAWRRFPFFYTLLALSELDHPKVRDELRYARGACEQKLTRLKPSNDTALRRIAVMERVLDAAG